MHIRSMACKKKVKKYFDKYVRSGNFQVSDLCLKKGRWPKKEVNEGKLPPNWEKPFRAMESLGNGAHRLQTIGGENLSRT